jgi:hypothetical protein
MGCVAAKKTATELADQAVYQPAVYANAAVPGPEVVVLPGEIKSSNYAFLQKVTANNLRDFAEIELSKDSFKVLDRADAQPLFNEIALAANLGDAEALKVFRKGRFKTTNWFLAFNIVKAEPAVYVTKGFDGETAGAMIDLMFTLANKGERSSTGKMIGQTVASAKAADSSAIWIVGLQYKIVNAATGEQVASGYIEDKMEATTSMNAFLGVANQQSTSVGLDTMAQRLIQKAVAEIDRQYKKGAGVAAVDAEEPAKGKSGKKEVVDPKKEKTILASYQKKLEERRTQQDKDAAITAMRCYLDGYVNLNQETVLAILRKDYHEKFHKKYDEMFRIPQKSPKWRDTIKMDASGITCDLTAYSPDACRIKLGGTYTVGVRGKTKTYAKDEVIDMVREDGQWKIASWSDVEDKVVQESDDGMQTRTAKTGSDEKT